MPADQPTIQAGINAAANGDTVLVSPGIYDEHLDFLGKQITVTSGARNYTEAAGTVLRMTGDGNNPVVTFHSGESRAASLNGFTIENTLGNISVLVEASPTLSNNAFIDTVGCPIAGYGSQAGPLIHGNHFSGTSGSSSASCRPPNAGAVGSGNAIVLAFTGAVEISDNLIENGDTTSNGVSDGDPPLFVLSTPSLILLNNVIRNNASKAESVAQIGQVTDLTVAQNLFVGNVSGTAAGKSGNSPALTIDLQSVYPSILHIVGNTIADNSAVPADLLGSQLVISQPNYIHPPLTAYVANNIIVGASQVIACQQGAGPFGQPGTFPGQLVLRGNDVFGSGVPQLFNGCPIDPASTGNLQVDPLFVAPNTGNFQVMDKSPVIAAGDVTAPDIQPSDLASRAREVCGTIDIGAYEKHPEPPVAVRSSSNPSVGGSSVTFTAQLTGNCNVPTGSVTFMDGTSPLGTISLNGTPSASFTTSGLTVGSHAITVPYSGDYNFDASVSLPLTQVVTGYPSMTTLSAIPNPSQALTSLTLTAVVGSKFGTPTGTVTFLANGNPIGTASLQANGIANATISTLGAGTYTIVAVYSADTNFAASSSAPVVEIVDGATTVTSISANPNPAYLLQPVALHVTVRATQTAAMPTGSVSVMDGSSSLGSQPLDASGNATFTASTLALGTHTITASFSNQSNFSGSSASTVVTVSLIPTTLTLAASPSSSTIGQSVTLTGTVNSATGAVVTSGTITFYDGSSLLGSSTISSNGQASLSISSLATGTHALTASFVDGKTFGPSTSSPFSETVLANDFSIAVSPSAVTLHDGSQGSVTVQLQSVGVFAGSLSLSHGSLPTYLTAVFNPASVTLGPGGSGSATLELSTFVRKADMERELLPRKLPVVFSATLLFTLLPLGWKRREGGTRLLILLLALVGLHGLVGCTNAYYLTSLVAPGTYNVPVTATDSQNRIHTTNFTIVVAP